jgi:hypothetical protein
MRILALWLPMVLLAASLKGQSEAQDPYWISLVSSELKLNSSGQKFMSSWGQKGLARLGDRAAVQFAHGAERPSRASNCPVGLVSEDKTCRMR